jgi:hypothetical protein
MEDESYQLIKKHIPKEWVIREFNRPDYGIDIVIELFNKIDEQLSEHLSSSKICKKYYKEEYFQSWNVVAKGISPYFRVVTHDLLFLSCKTICN